VDLRYSKIIIIKTRFVPAVTQSNADDARHCLTDRMMIVLSLCRGRCIIAVIGLSLFYYLIDSNNNFGHSIVETATQSPSRLNTLKRSENAFHIKN
jgi:hypothetical protein